MMDEPTADEKAVLAEMKRAWSENLRFYSNAGKEERERWVVAEFLTRLPVPFDPNELRSHVQNSKVDVEFRDARFQVKEIPDPNFRRGEEIKTTYRRVMNAKTLQDTVGPGFVYDVPRVESAYSLVRHTASELACSATYKDHKATLDLLCYVTRTRASLVSAKEVKPEELSLLGWRSISCLIGTQAITLYAVSDGPTFLQPLR